jgi:hypothetical protein
MLQLRIEYIFIRFLLALDIVKKNLNEKLYFDFIKEKGLCKSEDEPFERKICYDYLDNMLYF